MAARQRVSAAAPPHAREQIRVVRDLLEAAYGRPQWRPRHGAVDELIYTILSQNTADVNTERTYAELRRRFSTWAEVRDAPVEEVAAAIGLGGLAATKAPRIKAVLAALSGRTGLPELGELADMSDAAALTYLQRLPGVGPKTAACVLLFALGRPAMPVDTHVQRVATRLGLIPARLPLWEAHALLTRLAGAADVYALHINLVRHGREVCHARRPECDRCRLSTICPTAPEFLASA